MGRLRLAAVIEIGARRLGAFAEFGRLVGHLGVVRLLARHFLLVGGVLVLVGAFGALGGGAFSGGATDSDDARRPSATASGR